MAGAATTGLRVVDAGATGADATAFAGWALAGVASKDNASNAQPTMPERTPENDAGPVLAGPRMIIPVDERH